METSVVHLSRTLPAWRTGHTRERDALLLAVGLLISLVGLVPAFSLAVHWFSLPIPMPSLLATALVLAAYATVAVLIRHVTVASLVGLVALSTFAANVPLPFFLTSRMLDGSVLRSGCSIRRSRHWLPSLSFSAGTVT